MFKSVLKSLLFIVPVALVQVAFAQTHKSPTALGSTASTASSWSSYGGQTHEVDVNLSRAEIHSYKLGNNSYTDINIYGAYNRYLKDNIQIGGEGGLLSYPDGNSSKVFVALMGVFTYNLDHDLASSFFGNVGLGLFPAYDKDKNEYSSKFSFMFNAGKRIPLWGHVSYKPFFRLMKRGDMDMEFFVEAVNFSFMF